MKTNSALVQCPACSHSVSRSASGCPSCGHPFQNQTERENFAGKIIFVVLLLAGAGWYLVHTLNKMDDDQRKTDEYVKLISAPITPHR